MAWRCNNGLFDFGFPGFWLSCINWVCYRIDRQRLEMEEKVILRKHVRLISPFSLALSLQSSTFACPVQFQRTYCSGVAPADGTGVE